MYTVLHKDLEYPINHIQTMRRDTEMNAAHDVNMVVINRSNNPAYPYLQEEAILHIKGHEYRIKSVSEKGPYKNINALHIITDLSEMPFNQKLNGNYAPANLFNTLLSGTGWTVQYNGAGVDTSITLRDFGRNNVWRLFQDVCKLLKLEFEVLPGRILKVQKQLGGDNGKQFRYGYNLRNLTKDSVSTDVVTHVIVNYGEELANTETFVSSTAANYDRPIYGDIINDERITDKETARKRAEQQFRDVDISYEQDIAQLGESYELGETVYTIYEPLNDLSITTRILKLREEWDGEELVVTSATVGNYVFKTSDEILEEMIKDTEDTVKDDIEQTKEVMQREYRLELKDTVADTKRNITTEYTSLVSLTAQQLTTKFDEKVTNTQNNLTANYTSLISQTARDIRFEVSSNISRVDGNISTLQSNVSSLQITSSSIQSTVTSHNTQLNGLNTQMSSAQSNITQLSNQITSKVSYQDYTGAAITSRINQDPWAVTIDANKINLNGAVIVNGSISGATNINVQNNVNVGNAIYFNNQNFIDNLGGGMDLYAWNEFSVQATRADFNCNIYSYGNQVTTSRTSGLGFGYSAASKLLYVSINGSDVGTIQIR